ncbi:MAG TPA: tetratricopeptide repeat protein [Aestuariivirgaceae bacterium]|nr:tetratricopeptide repeat protein [Aestuariivirgaceae bacterium]
MSDESLFREVDEEVRREQAKKLWDRYGTYLVAVSLAVIVGVAGWKGWQYWQLSRSQAAAKVYFNQGADAAGPRDSDLQELARSGPAGYALLARFSLAGELAKTGKRDEAVKAYEAIAADRSVPQAFREAATIRAAYLLADTASSADLKARLADLDKPESVWRLPIKEIYALAAWREGRYQDAYRLVGEIAADPAAPQGMRQRAQIMAAVLQPLLKAKS